MKSITIKFPITLIVMMSLNYISNAQVDNITKALNDEAIVTTSNGDAATENIGIGNKYETVVNNITGKVWLDRNLGALQVATYYSDPQAVGDYYQWGRAAEGHQSRTSDIYSGPINPWIAYESKYSKWDGKFIFNNSRPNDWLKTQKDDLWSGTGSENNPCPSGFRLPTNAEWTQERLTWSSNDSHGAFRSPLKLPSGGYRIGTNGRRFAGNVGYYWSSTVDGSQARALYIAGEDTNMQSSGRAYGFSIRCIKD